MTPEKEGKATRSKDDDLDDIQARLNRLGKKENPRQPKETPEKEPVPTIEMESPEQMDIIKKVCLIGESGVGKKTILGKVAPFRKEWERYANTIGTTITKYCQSYSFVIADVKLLIMVWDITGRETFQRMQPSYYKGAEGLIVMADAGDMESIENIPRWIRAAYKVTDAVPTVVVINKIDLVPEEERKSLDRKVQEVLKGYEIPVFYTTMESNPRALTGPFHKLAELISERVKLQLAKKRYRSMQRDNQ